MHTGRYGGSVDGHAMRLALCDMARFYNLPVNLWGLSTVSETLDALYGYEATTQGLLAILAGVDEIYSMGLLGSARILSRVHHCVASSSFSRPMDRVPRARSKAGPTTCLTADLYIDAPQVAIRPQN